MMRSIVTIGFLACWSLRATALADPLAEGVQRCAGVADQTDRLVCFDKLAATVQKIDADRFGLTADIARQRDPAKRQADKAVLPGKIIALRLVEDGRFIFTLDNQQVWLQTQAEPRKQFGIGEFVHIEHGAMGSLWLAADKARKTKVKRIS